MRKVITEKVTFDQRSEAIEAAMCIFWKKHFKQCKPQMQEPCNWNLYVLSEDQQGCQYV